MNVQRTAYIPVTIQTRRWSSLLFNVYALINKCCKLKKIYNKILLFSKNIYLGNFTDWTVKIASLIVHISWTNKCHFQIKLFFHIFTFRFKLSERWFNQHWSSIPTAIITSGFSEESTVCERDRVDSCVFCSDCAIPFVFGNMNWRHVFGLIILYILYIIF